jgi:probable HAF family extracellular repeat protein
MKKMSHIWFSLLLFVLLLGHTLSAQSYYKTTTLQPLANGGTSGAVGINKSGIVVGTSELPGVIQHACIWSQNGTGQDLGTLGGSYSVGVGINNLGQVVGASSIASGTNQYPFLLTADGGMQNLGSLGLGLDDSATAINDSTEVVGFSCLGSECTGTYHAFLWTQATGIQDLGIMGSGWSDATAINDSGDVVGGANTGNSPGTAYSVIWQNAGAIQNLSLLVSPANPKLLGGGATGINASGQISANGRKLVYLLTPKTQTTLTSSPNPSAYGQTVVFTATVTSISGAPPDGESVTFKQGSTVLGTGMLTSGTAAISTSTLGVGTKMVTAVYGGDSNFVGSTSKTVSQVVSKATTTTSVACSLNPSNVGQAVTFTATVTPEFGGKIIGTVSFYDGTTLLKTVGASAAKFTTKTLASGTHSITATYNGSASFAGSSASLTQTVH